MQGHITAVRFSRLKNIYAIVSDHSSVYGFQNFTPEDVIRHVEYIHDLRTHPLAGLAEFLGPWYIINLASYEHGVVVSLHGLEDSVQSPHHRLLFLFETLVQQIPHCVDTGLEADETGLFHMMFHRAFHPSEAFVAAFLRTCHVGWVEVFLNDRNEFAVEFPLS